MTGAVAMAPCTVTADAAAAAAEGRKEAMSCRGLRNPTE